MAFTPRDWHEAPDTSTPLTAVNIENLEVRVTDYADLVSGRTGAITTTFPVTITLPNGSGSAALNINYQGTTHGVILNRTAGNPINGNVLLVTAQDTGTDANPQDTTIGVSGYETGKSTLKVSHRKPVAAVTGSDANASALGLRCNGAGTAAQGIFFDSEDGATTGKLINFRQNGVEAFVVGPTGDILTGGYNVNDWETAQQASWVYTMPDMMAQSALTLATGTKYGAVAFARKAGTYNNVVFCTGASTPSAVTDLKVAVWDSSGTLLQASANVSGTVTVASTVYEIPLAAGVTLTAGQRIYIGFAFIGTTLNVRGAAGVAAMVGTRTGRTFTTARANGSWAGGTVTTLSTGGTGIIPWCELT